MKRNRISTQQATAILSTLLEDKADMMPHRARILPNGTRVVEMVLPRGTKWKKFLVTINEVSIGYDPIIRCVPVIHEVCLWVFNRHDWVFSPISYTIWMEHVKYY